MFDFDVEVLDGANTAHLLEALLEVSDTKLIHLCLVLGGASHEVALKVVLFDSGSLRDQLVEKSLFVSGHLGAERSSRDHGRANTGKALAESGSLSALEDGREH